MKIFKYAIPIIDEFIIDIPYGVQKIHIGLQNDIPYIWLAVNESNRLVRNKFKIIGTGYDIPDDFLYHVGTVIMPNSLVWHLFYCGYEEIQQSDAIMKD